MTTMENTLDLIFIYSIVFIVEIFIIYVLISSAIEFFNHINVHTNKNEKINV